MAAQDPSRRKIGAAHDAVNVHGFFGIARTTRVEAAIRSQHRTDRVTIGSDQCCQDDAHALFTARQCFSNIAATLAEAGARLSDLVTMTVFIIDVRYGDRFTAIRKEIFPDGKFPASALITVAGFAKPSMLVEIQCVAVAE